MSSNEFPSRKNIRLKQYDYSTPGAYFVTICTAQKKNILWNRVGADTIRPGSVPLSHIGKKVQQAIDQIPKHYASVSVDKYCIMPDHVHLLLSVHTDNDGRIISAPTISTVVGSLKRWVTKETGQVIWQKSFYDHCIRDQNDYDQIWCYIENNPLKYSVFR